MTTRRKPDGGFRFIGAYELLGVYFAYGAKLIRWYDVRVWFACQEAVARRCGAGNSVLVRHHEAEIVALLGGPVEKGIRAALRRLQAAGLLRWSPKEITFSQSPELIKGDDISEFWRIAQNIGQANRKVPVPRRTIRFIAGGARKVVTATMLGHLLRCCYFRRSEYASEGSCSAAWVAALFGLDERNVKIARKHLVTIGWLVPVKSDAWHRQRFGGRWAVKPDWSWRESRKESAVLDGRIERAAGRERSPRIAALDSKRSPLLILKENSFGSKNQKPALAADRPTGFCKPESVSSKPPTLKHVVVEDLRETARTLRLFEHAVDAGFVRRCEADRLKVVAAAERALRVGKNNPCGLFAALVRRNLWHHLTQDEEECARRKLRCHCFERDEQAAFDWSGHERGRQQLSMDAMVVAAVKRALAQHRPDTEPFQALQRERPDWTSERWLRAEAELENSSLLALRSMPSVA